MYRNGREFCGGQVPYCTAATDMMIMMMTMMMMMIGIRLVGLVTRLWAGRYGVGIPVWTQDLSLLQNLWGPPSPLFSGYRGSVPGVKRRARDVNNSHPSSTEVKNEWSYASTSVIRLHGVDRENFAFYVSKISVLWNVRF